MSNLTNEQIQLLLDEARVAYHSLMMGQALVEVRDQNGELVRFKAANRADLYAYIQRLEGLLCPEATTGRRSYRPMGFVF